MKPRSDWTLPGHNYTGPLYNPHEKQLAYEEETGKNLKYAVSHQTKKSI